MVEGISSWDDKAYEYAEARSGEYFGCLPEQMFEHGAKWQRDQLRTDEAIERVARAIHDDECACGDLNNDRYGDDGTLYYLDKARIAITALLGEH